MKRPSIGFGVVLAAKLLIEARPVVLFAWWFLLIYGNGQPFRFGPLSDSVTCNTARQNVLSMTKHPAFGAAHVQVEACHGDTDYCGIPTPHYFATFVDGSPTILGPYQGGILCDRAYSATLESWKHIEPAPRHNFGVSCWPGC
ncbi:MAG: hypothetical protein ABSA52_16975 [Candidatus Binatia bacterium]|jgi:hypothetical protein